MLFLIFCATDGIDHSCLIFFSQTGRSGDDDVWSYVTKYPSGLLFLT